MPNLHDLPNLSAFQYHTVAVPPTARLRAWPGLMECERRLAFCKWIRDGVTADPGPNYRLLVEDFAGAFILSLEAAFQSLKTQWEQDPGRANFWTWVTAHPSYSLVLRGLRAIRHLYAHIELQPGTGQTVIGIGFGEGSTERRRDHWLPELTPTKLQSLKPPPPLAVADLPQWLTRYGRVEVHVALEEALRDLNSIIADAERAHVW